MCKSLETIINRHPNSFLQENILITEVQSGFRIKHSTIDQVVWIQNSINKAFRRGKKVYTIFVDIEKAFHIV